MGALCRSHVLEVAGVDGAWFWVGGGGCGKAGGAEGDVIAEVIVSTR